MPKLVCMAGVPEGDAEQMLREATRTLYAAAMKARE